MAAIVALLVVAQPYAAGYGDFRRSILDELLLRWGQPTWQHGALAPLICAWLVYARRLDLARLAVRPAPGGWWLAAFACLAYFAGYRANNFYLGAASIQLLLAAWVLVTFGAAHARVLLFPWLMLTFAWPLVFLEETLSLRMSLVSSNAVAALLNAFGVETLRDGTALLSAPTAGRAVGELFTLRVDAACSGMRSLFALLMVSALVGWHMQKGRLRRALLFALGIPLALVGNMARILILLGATVLFGQDFAVGNGEVEVSTFHFVSGIAVYLVALSGLLGLSRFLDRVLPRSKGKPTAGSASPPAPAAAAARWLVPQFFLLGLIAVTVLACRQSPPTRAGSEAGVVMELPATAGRFLGDSEEPSELEKNLLPADTEIVKMRYRTAGRVPLVVDAANVSLVLAGAERRSIHRPEVCLVGQGWTLLESKIVPVAMRGGGTLRVQDLLIERLFVDKEGRRRPLRAHYVYWFVGGDVTTPSNWTRVWLSSWDSIFRNVNHRWAYPSITALVTEGLTPEESGQRIRSADETLALVTELIQTIAPRFQKSLMLADGNLSPAE